ncbi:MAG: DUF5723 family protein, partial [Bacteroidales bacterium]|nr:DUF5723 family protein [Bacteroidales bacterium]
MKNKLISGFILLSLFGATVNAQVRQPHSLYFMETVPQITQMNPALQPRANGYVILPGFNWDFILDFAIKDAYQKHGGKWVTMAEEEYDYNKLWRSIGKKSTMGNTAVDLDIIGFGFRTGNGYFSFGLSEHLTGNMALPSDLFRIIEKGLPDGTLLDFSPMRFQAMAYRQISIGYSTKINDKLTVGVNVKPLFGQGAVTTKIDRFRINTGAQQWDLDAKGSIYASGVVDLKPEAGGTFDSFDDLEPRDFDNYETGDLIRDYGTSLNNPGIAFDLGAAYQVNERLAVSAALNNLGFISWKNDLYSTDFNGQYTFNGLYYDVSKEESINDRLDNLVDSLESAVNSIMGHDKFRTALPPVFHAGATYQLTPAISAGLLSRSVFWRKGIRQSFNTSINIQPYSFVSFSAGATWQVKGNVAAGIGLTGLIGPLQIYLLADGIPLSYSRITIVRKDDGGNITDPDEFSFIPDRMSYGTLRLGLNLIFGRHGYA